MTVISDTSPLLYLYRIGGMELLPQLFGEVWVPDAVRNELLASHERGYDVPSLAGYSWLSIVNPNSLSSEWLVLDLGAGELAVIALALEHPKHITLLDDMLARRMAQAAGLRVWGTLRVLLESKSQGMIDRIEPYVMRLQNAGMWLSPEIIQRILILAQEGD